MNPTISQAIENLAPGTQWACYGDYPNYTIQWINPSVAPVTNAQIDAEYQRLLAQVPIDDCKEKALSLLVATDWVNQPDVTDPSSTPHLLNKDDFLIYRNQVRIFAVYPVAGNIDWPVVPVEQWSDPLENLP